MWQLTVLLFIHERDDMSDAVRMRASLQGDIAEIKVLIHHDMETGLRKNAKTGATIPAHFIKEVSATLNGTPVMSAQWGIGISKNPFFEFRVKGAKAGDKVAILAVDNLGEQYTGETQIA